MFTLGGEDRRQANRAALRCPPKTAWAPTPLAYRGLVSLLAKLLRIYRCLSGGNAWPSRPPPRMYVSAIVSNASSALALERRLRCDPSYAGVMPYGPAESWLPRLSATPYPRRDVCVAWIRLPSVVTTQRHSRPNTASVKLNSSAGPNARCGKTKPDRLGLPAQRRPHAHGESRNILARMPSPMKSCQDRLVRAARLSCPPPPLFSRNMIAIALRNCNLVSPARTEVPERVLNTRQCRLVLLRPNDRRIRIKKSGTPHSRR